MSNYITPEAAELDRLAIDAAIRLQAKWSVGKQHITAHGFDYADTRDIANALTPAIAAAFVLGERCAPTK